MFGLNNAQLIGRLGADATISHLTNGGRVANVSIATDESYLDKNSGDKVDRTEWHRIVTFQDGLVEMMEKHAKKGRLVYVSGKLQTRKWRKDGEDSDRFSTEILLVPAAGCNFSTSRTVTARRRSPAIPCLPPKPPRRWMTARFRSNRASSLPRNSGPVPAKLACGWPFFFDGASGPGATNAPIRTARRDEASRSARPPHTSKWQRLALRGRPAKGTRDSP